jgi:hypothetical protein
MPDIKKYLNRPLKAREAAIVLLIAAALAGGGYASYKFAAAKVLESKVNAAMPGVCAEIRKQQETIIKAVEAYQSAFGFYPPDNVTNRNPLTVDAVNNPLLYEIAGVVYNPTNQIFELAGLEAAEAKFVKEFFHCTGFKNSGESAGQVKRFLPAGNLPARQLHDDPDVFAVGYQIPTDGVSPEIMWEFDISPWRYVSSAPTNNVGRFDLWIEVKTKAQAVTIGNWKAVE